MRHPLDWVRALFLERFQMHPARAILMAYRDGELPAGRCARIANHLQHCQQCNETVLSLEKGLQHFGQFMGGVEVGPLVEAGLTRLQEAMAGRNLEGTQIPLPVSKPLISPVALDSIQTELTIYIGAQAAEKILARARSTMPTPQDLVDTIEPLMVGLLGSRGASAVAGKVALLCGSPNMVGPSSAAS